jgi:hypothetical protein
MTLKFTGLLAASASAALLCASAAWADDDQTAAPAPAAAASGPTAPAPAAPTANPMPYPSMGPTISANPNPGVFDAGPIFGKIMVDGVVSGGGLYQTNPGYASFNGYYYTQNKTSFGDLDNAQLIINKTDGPVQFYVQAGAYSITSLGSPYYKSLPYDNHTFGYVPQGFVKLVPNSSFSIEAGALPTLIGAEYTFSFENLNIERGLLWNQEPAISKGVQANFTQGPWALSLAWTDGYYSGTYTALSGAVTYTFKNSDTLEFTAEGNMGTNHAYTFVTPVQQNNGAIYNLIYSHTQGPWTVTPYIQYTASPSNDVSYSGSTWGAAVLAKYSFTPQVSLAGRVEYEGSSGEANLLGYGVDSNAYSVTLTPAYQKGIFFIRGELSYVGVSKATPGYAFGTYGTATSQFRVMGEAGFAF